MHKLLNAIASFYQKHMENPDPKHVEPDSGEESSQSGMGHNDVQAVPDQDEASFNSLPKTPAHGDESNPQPGHQSLNAAARKQPSGNVSKGKSLNAKR